MDEQMEISLKTRSSKDVVHDLEELLKIEYNDVRWLTPQELSDIVDLSDVETIKLKRVIDLLVFKKVLKFNTDFLLWENQYWRNNE